MIEEDWESKVWDMIYNQKRIEEAIKYLDKILEQHPQNDQAYAIRANAFNQLASDTKNWNYTIEALKCADRAIQINPHNDIALFNKAWSLVDLGKPREALECANRALEANPNNVYAWYNKAWAHYMLYEIEEALNCCDEMKQIDPKFTRWAEDMKHRIENREFPEHLAKFRRQQE